MEILFVTPDITREAVYMHAETALHEYIRRAQKLSTLLTHSSGLTSPSSDFLSSASDDEKYCDRRLKIQLKIFRKNPTDENLKL